MTLTVEHKSNCPAPGLPCTCGASHPVIVGSGILAKPQYETGTHDEVLKAMANAAIREENKSINFYLAAMQKPEKSVTKCEAKIRDFRKLGGLDE